jgi:hypothetical protein
MSRNQQRHMACDNGPHTVYDQSARRQSYRKCDFNAIQRIQSRKLKFVTAINFVKDDFEVGATQWFHLKQEPLSRLLSIFNSLAYVMGNKRRFHLPVSSGGGGGTGTANNARGKGAKTVNTNQFTFKNDDDINVFFETLLSQNKKNKVFGFRLLIFEFDLLKSPSLSSSMDMDISLCNTTARNNGDGGESTSSSSSLYKGVHESFNECIEVVKHRWDKAFKGKVHQPPKGTLNIEQYKALDRTLEYMKSATYPKVYIDIYAPYRRDHCKIDQMASLSDEDDDDVWGERVDAADDEMDAQDVNHGSSKQKTSKLLSFVDNRRIDENTDVATIFSIDSSMLYNVTNKIQPQQCDIKTYFKQVVDVGDDESPSSSLPTTSSTMTNGKVRYITHTSFKESQFVGFFNQETTYALPKSTLLPEYIVKMPLPHAIGSLLECLEDNLPNDEEGENMRINRDADRLFAAEDENGGGGDDEQADSTLEANENDEYPCDDVIYGDDDNDDNTMISPKIRDTNVQYEEDDDDDHDNNDNNTMRHYHVDGAGMYTENELAADLASILLNDNGEMTVPEMEAALKKKRFKIRTPLGLHSTVYNPSSMEILRVPKQNGRFASLRYIKDDRDITAKTVKEYKQIIDDVVKSALCQSVIPTLAEKSSYFFGDYEKLRNAPLESPQDQAYYSNTPPFQKKVKGGGSGPFASVHGKGNVDSADSSDDDDDDYNTRRYGRSDHDVKLDEFNEFLFDEMMRYDQSRNLTDSERLERSYVANGTYLEIFKDRIGRYRSVANDYESVMKDVAHDSPNNTTAQLEKDIFCRLSELNTRAWRNLEAPYFRNGVIKPGLEKEYAHKRRELMEALGVEVFHEILNNEHVTNACLEVRKHFTRLMETSKVVPGDGGKGNYGGGDQDGIAGQKGIFLSTTLMDGRLDARPYGQYRIWLQKFFTDSNGLDVHSNFKNMDVIYHARLHHCRHFTGLNLPAHMGVLIQGRHGCGKSFQLLAAALCSIAGVPESLVRFTKNALSVEGNKSDYYKILEELPPDLLGHNAASYSTGGEKSSGGGGGGNNSKGGAFDGALSELASLLKAMLCAPEISVARGNWNQENGKVYEVKTVALMQGVIMAALNYDVNKMEPALRDRFIHLLGTSSKDGKNAINSTPNMCQDHDQRKKLISEAVDMHHVYYIVEMMMKSNVLGVNPGYGVNMTVSNVLLPLILDHLQSQFNINTENERKRRFVEEMARIKTINSRVFEALKSPLLHHLSYYPQSKKDYAAGKKPTYIGFNLRVIFEGIFPFLFVTKDELFCSLFSLNSLWQVDYLTEILKFLLSDSKMASLFDKNCKQHKTLDCFKSKKISENANGSPATTIDYNYNFITITLTTKKEVYMKKIATQALEHKSDLSEKYVTKVIDDLCEEYDEELPSYRYDAVLNKLVKDEDSTPSKRKVMELSRSFGDGPLQIIISVPYLKKRLPHILTDDIVEDLSKQKDEIAMGDANDENGSSSEGVNVLKPLRESKYSPEERRKIAQERASRRKKDDELYDIYEKIAAIDHERIENYMANTIATICQNPALEKVTYLGFDENGDGIEWCTPEIEERFYEDYKNRYMVYTISEPVKEIVKLSERYPTLPKLTKTMAQQYDMVYFYQHIGTLTLERKENGELLRIENKNEQTPCSKSLLYENDFSNFSHGSRSASSSNINGRVKKNRAAKFDVSAVVVCNEDIDWHVTKAHFLDLGISLNVTIGDDRQAYMAFPTFRYMLMMEFTKRVLCKKWKLLHTIKPSLAEFETLVYPRCDIDADLQRAYVQLQAKLISIGHKNQSLLRSSVKNQEKIIGFNTLAHANYNNTSSKLLTTSTKTSTIRLPETQKLDFTENEEYLKRKAGKVEFFTMMQSDMQYYPATVVTDTAATAATMTTTKTTTITKSVTETATMTMTSVTPRNVDDIVSDGFTPTPKSTTTPPSSQPSVNTPFARNGGRGNNATSSQPAKKARIENVDLINECMKVGDGNTTYEPYAPVTKPKFSASTIQPVYSSKTTPMSQYVEMPPGDENDDY